MGACVLNGIGAGPAETIQLAVIADIFFLHDRGFWNTFYWCFYMGSLMVAPIVSGSMALHVGWRNFLVVVCRDGYRVLINGGLYVPRDKMAPTAP